MSNRGIPQL